LMPMICRFGLLLGLQSSCIFFLQFFSLFSKSSVLFFNIYFVFEPGNSVFNLFLSAGVLFICIFYLT
jgi:hypothetical protein